MKKVLIYSLTLAVTFSLATTAQAVSPNTTVGQDAKMLRNQMKDAHQETVQLMKDNKASMSAEKNNRVFVRNADLTAISGTTLTIMKDGKTLTVTTDANTMFHRHFGGAATLAEFSVGDKVDVLGTFTDDTKTTIAAKSVRNRSVVKLHGAFIGDVVSFGDNILVLRTKNHGDQTVTVTATTKYVNRKEVAITVNDVVAGQRIRVKGMWDKAKNTITEVTQIKDFSLPPQATDSATPSVTTTP